MGNIINYVLDEKEPFSSKAFHAIDSLVFAQLAYLNFEGFVPDITEEAAPILLGQLVSKENEANLYLNTRDVIKNQRLLHAAAESPRFQNTYINYFVNEIDDSTEKQFSAVTFLMDDGVAYIAYRGTDATFVGWKEDFNMSFSITVPSQTESARYLDQVGKLLNGEFITGGHSKGGNLAVYATMKCHSDIQKRVKDIYSLDGPGFRKELFESEEYQRIKDRIHQLIPQTALVGMLLESYENYVVVKSRQLGIMQHDPFSWVVKNNDFVYLEQVDNISLYTNKVLDTWLASLSDEKRALFIDTLYNVIKSTGAKSFSDLTEDWWEKFPAALYTIRGLDEVTLRFVIQTIQSLIRISVRMLHSDIKSRLIEKEY